MANYSLRRVGFLGATVLLTGALISAPTQAAGRETEGRHLSSSPI
jgi:hypothetical protein